MTWLTARLHLPHAVMDLQFSRRMASTLLHPRSIGSITLRSADPLVHPVINANYFADKHDLNVLVAGLKLNRKLAQQPVYKGHLGAEIIDETIPHNPASDEYLAEYARRYSVTVYHPVGSCKMGPASDPLAVVDGTALSAPRGPGFIRGQGGRTHALARACVRGHSTTPRARGRAPACGGR